MKRVLGCLALCLAACGGLGDKASTFDMSSASNDASAAADAGSCTPPITITPQGAFAPVTLVATVLVSGSVMPSWTVFGPTGALTPLALDGSNLRVSIDATQPGTYSFDVTFASGAWCDGAASVVVLQPQARAQAYRLRLTPPASSALPQQDVLVQVVGNTPQTAYTVQLQSGATLSGTLLGPSGPISGQVALAAQSGPPVLAPVAANGLFALPFRLDGMYTLLLEPSASTLAPHLLGPIDGATLAASSFAVGAGVTVGGVVRDASLQPLAGANVVLHSGLRPSSLGVSGATGTYALHVEPPGSALASLVVSAAGWPDVTLDGLSITGATTLGVDEQAARLAVTLKVVRSDGTTPISGAHLSLRAAPIANAAVVHTANGDRAASGQVHVDLVTAADGTVAALLPAAAYDVLVDPGALSAGTSDGITGLHVTIGAAGTVTLAVAPQVTFAGAVLDGNGVGVAGVRVRATPQAGSAVVGTTASDGTFSLPGLGAGLPVVLEVAPPPTALLAGVTQTLGDPMTLGGALPTGLTISLSRGLALAGTVMTPGGNGLGGVGIDVLCATCGDPTPLYHTDTTTGGGYALYVPDPGLIEVPDGGVGLD